MEKYVIGIDVGGTKTEAILALTNQKMKTYKLLSKQRIPTEPKNPEQYLKALANLVLKLVEEQNLTLSQIAGIGIGLPGSLTPGSRIMINGNTLFLKAFDLKTNLRQQLPDFKGHLQIENDANLFALSEVYIGAGIGFEKDHTIQRGNQIAIGITFGTGVGGGLINQGQIFEGSLGAALEVGHISLNPQGPLCYCGQKGCAEAYLSGTAINKLHPDLQPNDFNQRFNTDPDVKHSILAYRAHLAHFLSVLTNLFNPHYFVFGGGLSEQPLLFEGIEKDLSHQVFLGTKYTPSLLKNKLGGSSGVFGAMILAAQWLEDPNQCV